MRVLFLSDPAFTDHEQIMLRRLAIGLADEGTRVAWAVSEQHARQMTDTLLVPIIPFQRPRLGLSLKQRAANLLEHATEALSDPPDIIHMFGGAVFSLGAEATRRAAASPAFELWRPNLEANTRIAVNRACGSHAGDADQPRPPLIITPTKVTQSRIAPHFPEAVVRCIPWGIHAAEPHEDQGSDAISIVLIGPGRDGRAWQAAFRAAIRVLAADDRVHLFADAEATRKLRVWPDARKAGVLGRLSLMDNAEFRRELAMRADIMLYPDARGESRTILLDAMASSVALVAATDPLAESLIDGTTCRLVTDPTEHQWQEAIEHLVQDPAARRRLSESATAYIHEHHRATRQIVSLTDAYEWVAGDPVRIGSNDPAPI